MSVIDTLFPGASFIYSMTRRLADRYYFILIVLLDEWQVSDMAHYLRLKFFFL